MYKITVGNAVIVAIAVSESDPQRMTVTCDVQCITGDLPLKAGDRVSVIWREPRAETASEGDEHEHF